MAKVTDGTPKTIKKSRLNTPHDRLFKKSMKIPTIAKDFLMMHLPDEIKEKIDYTTLEILSDTFTNEKLRRSQVDALFKVQYDHKDLLIYVLVEQQSKPDHTMPTRRLSYKSDIWAAYLETQENKENTQLPPIIDLHFYTGLKPYEGPLSLADLAGDNAEIVHQCLIQPMINVWAGDITDEQLKTNPWAATVEYIMINRRTSDLRAVLRKIAPNMRMFYLEKQNEFVLSLYTYIEHAYEAPNEEFARIAGEEISSEAEEDIMTMAEQLILRGKEQKSIEIAQYLLNAGSDPVFVAKATGLSPDKIKSLQKKAN